MRHIGKFLSATAVGALILTGCSDADDPDEVTTGDPVQTTESTEDDAGSTGAPGEDATESDAVIEDPGSETAVEDDGYVDEDDEGNEGNEDDEGNKDDEGDEGDEGDDEAGGDLPGDPRQALEMLGALDGDKVRVDPETPADPGVGRAMCEYVFGKPSEVAEITGIAGEVTLLESSGYEQWPGQGDGLQCVWDVDGEDGLGILLWSQELPPAEEDDATQIVSSGQVGEHWGAVAYAPTFTGDVMDEDSADGWLEDAATRWGGASG